MTTTHIVSRRITATLAIVFLLPPLYFFIKWSSIGLRITGISEQEKMSTYRGYFPPWLQDITTIHLIAMVCCIISIILASRSFSKNLLSVRVLMLVTVVAACFILLFNIYQMVYWSSYLYSYSIVPNNLFSFEKHFSVSRRFLSL